MNARYSFEYKHLKIRRMLLIMSVIKHLTFKCLQALGETIIQNYCSGICIMFSISNNSE